MDDLAKQRQFTTTRWSLVIQAAQTESREESQAALRELCETYWQPVYHYLRADGKSPEEAMDIVQGFMAWLLEKANLARASSDRGKFRSYLLGALKHYLYDLRKKEGAMKRGGNCQFLSIDVAPLEKSFAFHSIDKETPETIYRRQWAYTLLKRVLEEVREAYKKQGRESIFEELKLALTGDLHDTYAEIGQRLNMSEGAIKVAVHRLKKSYRQTLVAQVAETVDEHTTVKEEIEALLEAL